MNKKTLIFLVVFIACIFSIPQAFSKELNELTKLRVGYLPVVNQLPIVISYARDNSSFKKVTIDLRKYKSWTAIEAALRVKAIDAAVMTVPIALSMAADQVPIKIIGIPSRGGSVLIVKNIDSVKKLSGKLLGVLDLDNTENLLLYTLFKKEGLRLGIDVRTIGVTYERAVKDLAADKIDGIFLPEPIGTTTIEEGLGHILEETKTLAADKITSVILIRSELIEKNEEAIQEWMSSLMNNCTFIEKDIADTEGKQVSIIQEKYFGLSRDLFSRVLKNSKEYLSFNNLKFSKEDIKEIVTITEAIRLITTYIDLDFLLDLRFIKGK